jgi:hypothetical protein
MLVARVGTIKPANANSGGMNIVRPDISTSGIANPTTPFTNPAMIATIAAKPTSYGVKSGKSVSIALHNKQIGNIEAI